MRYIPHTDADRQFMLEAIGVACVDDLFADIPEALRVAGLLDVPSAMSEPDLLSHMGQLAQRNTTASRATSFLGGGTYRHHIPTAVSQLLLRGELYTAYTPYQPEVAQGTLQIIFEFQTMVSELLGTEVVNASLYDGASACAEAALMMLRVKKRNDARVLVSGALHPHYREVIELFVSNAGAAYVELPVTSAGTTDLTALERELDAGAAGAIVGYPTFYGTMDDIPAASALCHDHGALLTAGFQEAIAFGLLASPGSLGADIVAGEGQSLGVPASFGGPHLGLFGTRSAMIRQMPGRISGQTLDSRGERGFVLTMSTREQHIRREKATSNICTNQGLMATAATIYMTLLGPAGLKKIATASHLRAEQTKAAIAALDGYALWYDGPTFHEFVVRTPRPASELVAELGSADVGCGIALGQFDEQHQHALLVTCTELTTESDITTLVEALRRAG